MDSLTDFVGLFTESRMKYGHLTILILYGLLTLFVFAPFIGLIFAPPDEPIDLADLGPHYWKYLATAETFGVVLGFVLAFNAGIVLYGMQVLTTQLLWKRVVKPLANLIFRARDASKAIDTGRVGSDRFEDKPQYGDFLYWLEEKEQAPKRRVRSWDWFMSNAVATLGFLVFLFLGLNVVTAAAALVFSSHVPITLSWRSALLLLFTLIVLLLIIPAAIKHYRVRAEGDALLYQEYLKAKSSSSQQTRPQN